MEEEQNFDDLEFDFTDVDDDDDSSEYEYGYYPLKQRYAADQVPLSLRNRDYTFDYINSGDCHVAEGKKDLTKMFGTLHLCVRAQGTQLVEPTVVYKGLSPADDDCSRPKQKKKWKEFVTCADPRLNYLFEVDGWMKGPQSEKWIRQFHDRTKQYVESENYRVLQEDNWGSQISTQVKWFMLNKRIYLVNTPGNMTDLLSVIDDGLGNFMKDRIALKYS